MLLLSFGRHFGSLDHDDKLSGKIFGVVSAADYQHRLYFEGALRLTSTITAHVSGLSRKIVSMIQNLKNMSESRISRREFHIIARIRIAAYF